MFFNGSPAAGLTINLTGTVAAGDVFVVAQSSANATILAQADQTNGAGWFNGDDAVALRKGTTVIDVIGQIGFDPGHRVGHRPDEHGRQHAAPKGTITAGDTNGADAFDPAVEWDGFATDTFDGLGSHLTPALTCGGPLAVEAGVGGSRQVNASDGDGTVVDIAITNVTPVAGRRFDLANRVYPGFVAGGHGNCHRRRERDVPVGSYSSSLTATNDDATPQTGTCTLTVNVTSPVPIHDIQGSAHLSPLNGTSVIGVHGIVTAKRSNGFYCRTPIPDANDATSEGILVFTELRSNRERRRRALGDGERDGVPGRRRELDEPHDHRDHRPHDRRPVTGNPLPGRDSARYRWAHPAGNGDRGRRDRRRRDQRCVRPGARRDRLLRDARGDASPAQQRRSRRSR